MYRFPSGHCSLSRKLWIARPRGEQPFLVSCSYYKLTGQRSACTMSESSPVLGQASPPKNTVLLYNYIMFSNTFFSDIALEPAVFTLPRPSVACIGKQYRLLTCHLSPSYIPPKPALDLELYSVARSHTHNLWPKNVFRHIVYIVYTGYAVKPVFGRPHIIHLVLTAEGI